jgi:hypothetical protein
MSLYFKRTLCQIIFGCRNNDDQIADAEYEGGSFYTPKQFAGSTDFQKSFSDMSSLEG